MVESDPEPELPPQPTCLPTSIPVLVHSPTPPLLQPSSGPSGTAKLSSKPASPAKPRSTKPAKPARSPSPSPPPPPPLVPLQTVRLEIRLGGPSNYEVDIARQAKDTGQRPLTPPVVSKKVADSSDEEEEEPDDKDDKSKANKKKKKNAASEYYDTADPFIDDSELAVDERQFFAQTKQKGFYVSSGEVALLKDKTPKKPKSKKTLFTAGLHSSLQTAKKSEKQQLIEGTRESPITIDPIDKQLNMDDSSMPFSDDHAGQKRKRHNSISEGGKRKKVIDETMFHPELQFAIKEVKELIAKESWEQKGKFPSSLKPPLAKLALLAIRLDEYDDDFFSLMPTLFPYNKFTMTKLIKRTVFTDHLLLLTERQDALLTQLTQLANEGFSKAREEWERNLVLWDKRQGKLRTEAAEASTGTAGPTRHSTEEVDEDSHVNPPSGIGGTGAGASGDVEGGKDNKDGKDHGQHPPGKRYRLTEAMKSIVWELVLLSNESCRLENEKNSLEGSVIQISDQGLRKVLYQKIVAAFPEGWMSSGQISKDVSATKKKLEKEAMEQELE